MKRPGEIWKPVVDFEDIYQVSDRGNVRSISRKVRYADGRIRYYPAVVRAKRLVAGYPAVDLKRDGKRVTAYVHHLIAEAFIGPRPPGKQVAHRDGRSHRSVLSNIRYATPKENDADKIGHGTRPNGEKNGQSKLSDRDVRKIRVRCKGSESQRIIAADFGVGQSVISRIKTGRAWGHL